MSRPPIYMLSDSDSASEKDSDGENFLLSIDSPLCKKAKNEPKNLQLPTKQNPKTENESKVSQSPKKVSFEG